MKKIFLAAFLFLTPFSAALSARDARVSVRVTAYSSQFSQTDSTPHITATGTRTRPGVIALSRDLLGRFPYGSRVWLRGPGGVMGPFRVEDTMSSRKRLSADIWMSSRSQALSWGARQLVLSAHP